MVWEIENETPFAAENGAGSTPLQASYPDVEGFPGGMFINFFYSAGVTDASGTSIQVLRRTEDYYDNEFIGKNVMLFAEGWSSHLRFALVISGPKRGCVYAVEDGNLIFDEAGNLENPYSTAFLAKSFAEFIDNLYPNEGSMENWEDDEGYLPDDIKQRFGKP